MRSCALFAVEPEEVAGIARDLDFAGLSCQARTFDDGVPEARVDMACVWIGADVQGALAFCQVLRKEEAMKQVPVLALVRAEHLREIFLRENVFDDFIVVPYQTPELEARVRQLLIRTRQGDEGEQLAFGPLEINLATYQVHVAGEPVDLTYMEYELLKFLATHRGRVFTRQALLSRVWGYDYFGGTRTVDVHVRRLRAKLGEHANVIQTVRNVGYKFAL